MTTNYLYSLQKARLQYDAAFHLLNVTFPSINDSKILLGVVNNLFTAVENCLDSILAFERQLHLIPAYNDEFESKFNTFKYRSVKHNRIDNSFVNLIFELREIVNLHKKSPVEFRKGGQYLMFNEGYEMKQLSSKDIRVYLDKTKEFLALTESIVNNRIKPAED